MAQMSKSPVADHQGRHRIHDAREREASAVRRPVGFHAIPTPVPTRTTLDPSAFMM
jgi:hypothetical protein